MSSNLPPGITECMIPGNRTEEAEIGIILAVCEIEALLDGPTNPNYEIAIEAIKEQWYEIKLHVL